MKSRRTVSATLACEPLERRQLLAGDVCLADAPISRIDDAHVNLVQDLGRVEIPAAALTQPAIVPTPDLMTGLGLPLSIGDLLEEQGGLVATVRQSQTNTAFGGVSFQATLHLFQRGDDGALTESATIELGFEAQTLLLTDELVIAIGKRVRSNGREPGSDGTGFYTQAMVEDTVLLAISRQDPSQRTTLTFADTLVTVANKDDRLVVTTRNHGLVIPLIYPPPPLTYQVHVVDIGGETLKKIASGEMLQPVTENMIVGDDIVALEQRQRLLTDTELNASADLESGDLNSLFHRPHRVVNQLVRYRIVGDGIERVAELTLGEEPFQQFEVSADGQTAVVTGTQQHLAPLSIRDRFPLDVWGSTSVYLIDLAKDQPSLFQRIDVPTRVGGVVAEIGEQAVVIADGTNVLHVVDIDQSIDIAAEHRVRRVELPTSPDPIASWIASITEISPQSFLVTRQGFQIAADLSLAGGPTFQEIHTLSLGELAIVSSVEVEASALAVFVPGAPNPHLIGFNPFLNQFHRFDSPPLIVGEVDEAGQFSQLAEIRLVGALELDANADRLLIRKVDQLMEYRWDDIENPIITPLGDPLTQLTAVDDSFERNVESRDQYLDVLANDVFANHYTVPQPQIVELVGAPAGVTIVPAGTRLRLTEDILQVEGTVEFQYVVQQGDQTATGTVTLTLIRYEGEDVRAAVNRIITQAAADLDVPAAEIELGAQRGYLTSRMPAVIGANTENPFAGQFGVIADVLVAGQLYRYAANFDGDVVQLTNRQLETAMSLSMRAVDADGNPIATLQSGDDFFVEVTAQDLRASGSGVFGVAFDLPIPSNKLQLTGEMILLGAFDDFGESITAAGIDEFKAFESLIEHPGNASQPVVRFGLRAIAGGEVDLRLDPAETLGAELLLRGRDDEVSPLEVEFGTLRLSIAGIDPNDTDANGAVTPIDALRVINFLGKHGNVHVEELAGLELETVAEGENAAARLAAMRRLDTNADGQITARDALNVINDIARRFRTPNIEAESVDAALQGESRFADEGLATLF